MPVISKIRFTNIIYENGDKRFNDDIFQFEGHNGVILLENGGGKTVFVQTAIQAMLPHEEVADRKIKDTLMLENNAAHIAIEWIMDEHPRRYALTAVTLFMNKGSVDSHKFVYEYGDDDDNSIEKLPFVRESIGGNKRAATKEEMGEYYYNLSQNRMNAHTFSTIKAYQEYIEENFKIIPSEWRKIALINGAEGDVEAFFDACQTKGQLVDNLLIPVVEEAIAGNGTNEFADTFEKQREHFKKYKQLRSRIDESKKVEHEIDQYVKVFQIYDGINSKFIKSKQQIKAIYKFTEEEKKVNKEKILENEKNEEELKNKEKKLKQMETSYELALLKDKLKDSEKNLKEAQEKYNEVYDDCEEKQKRYENLQAAEYRKEIKEYTESIEYLNKKIDLLNKDEAAEEINEKLSLNSSELRGYYLEEEQKLQKEKNVIESQIESAEDEYRGYDKEINMLREKKNEITARISETETTIKLMDEEMNRIARETLANPLQEKVSEECIKWQDKVNKLEQNIFSYAQQIKALEEEKKNLISVIPELHNKFTELQQERTEVKGKLQNIKEKHDSLLIRLKEINSSWSVMDSIYLKQNSILNQLELRTEFLRGEREELLLKERLAHRFLDDYKENQYFTADPELPKWIMEWGSQFKLLESGTKYVQRAAKVKRILENEIYELYPYWSASLIAADSETEKLISKIKKCSDKLMQPVFIMTEKEARGVIDGEKNFNERGVFPEIWHSNLSQDAFEGWRDEIALEAKRATEDRENKEKEIDLWNELLRDVKSFYVKYPYEEYTDLIKTHKDLKEKTDLISADIQDKEERKAHIEDDVKKYADIINDAKREGDIFGNKIQRANEYKNKEGVKLQSINGKYTYDEALKQNDDNMKICDRRINRSKDIIENLKQEFRNATNRINLLKGDPLYDEVKSAVPKHTEVSRKVLCEERKDLKDAQEKKQRGRQQLEDSLKSAQNNLEKAKEALKNFSLAAEHEIEENLDFPLKGNDEIERLLKDIKKQKGPLKKLKDELAKTQKEYDSRENTYKLREDDFYKIYEEIIIFTQNLKEIKSLINKENEKLRKKIDYNIGRKSQLINEKENIDGVLIDLKTQNGRFAYLSDEIEEAALSEDIVSEFPYKRQEMAQKFIENLMNLQKELETKFKEVEAVRQQFVKFCDDEINDIKLKDMAVTGVKVKKEYGDIIEWQKRMNERISRTIEIAENDMREHDKEVQQFISHLHTYLRSMADELKMIPKKTRVKIDDDWKEIFSFSVPDWDEKEGKEELSRHIDWMLNQLENEQYLDENGMEDETLMRKSIEKWLKSKQLLKLVMKNNFVNVKCRKVTNDNKVSSKYFEWETSNKWSGGEKWSKNMTLFLGILNYLAEKRKQISTYNKRHRTVIVDNPFGKASSDHVLDPVFFIAEQLGFQIIALTAHSEGKFIRTYFPIVYSCRLRNSKNSSSQIITKEREIHTVFFRDNDPETLMRLGQIQQMKLF